MTEPKPFVRWVLEAICQGDLANEWEVIHLAYAEPHRRYHTLEHVEEMLTFFFQHDRQIYDDNASFQRLCLAAIYHDIIYDPRATDNEERSVEVMRQQTSRLFRAIPGSYPSMVDSVAEMIMMTAHHQPDGANQRWLADADLMRFAAEPPISRMHNDDIRLEYSHVSDESWAAGRTVILSKFLTREPFFYTKAFGPQDARRARENILAEMLRSQKEKH